MKRSHAAAWHLVFSPGAGATAQPKLLRVAAQPPGQGLIAEDIWRATPRCFHPSGKGSCDASSGDFAPLASVGPGVGI